MHSVSILGAGRAGVALALALSRAGFPISQLIYRSKSPDVPGLTAVEFGAVDSIVGELLIIATGDPEIRGAAEALADSASLPTTALHLSGSLSSSELAALQDKGVQVGSMHPLVSISDPIAGANCFDRAFFCLEGDPGAVDAARSLVDRLGGRPFSVDTASKPLYHASAVMASGHVAALFDAAVEMLSKCGLSAVTSREVLLPLLESMVSNLTRQSTRDALTGPFARGDLQAMQRHLAAMENTVDDNLRAMYLELAERSVRLAGGERSAELLEAISMAKRKTGC